MDDTKVFADFFAAASHRAIYFRGVAIVTPRSLSWDVPLLSSAADIQGFDYSFLSALLHIYPQCRLSATYLLIHFFEVKLTCSQVSLQKRLKSWLHSSLTSLAPCSSDFLFSWCQLPFPPCWILSFFLFPSHHLFTSVLEARGWCFLAHL